MTVTGKKSKKQTVTFPRSIFETADYLIDLGPEGGAAGGEVVATGTPEEIAAVERSYTGRFLKSVLFG